MSGLPYNVIAVYVLDIHKNFVVAVLGAATMVKIITQLIHVHAHKPLTLYVSSANNLIYPLIAAAGNGPLKKKSNT